MTSYTIELGYRSGYGFDGTAEEAWQALKNICLAIADNPERIAQEARRLGCPETCDEGCCTLMEHCERYKNRSDLTLTFHESEDGNWIGQAASGSRALKEKVRRAFCRLVMEEAHKIDLEINLRVS